jgi:hypothetical protein
VQVTFQESFGRLGQMVMSMNMNNTNQETRKSEEEGQGEKRNNQIREDDMTDIDNEVMIQQVKYPRWQMSVDKIVNTLKQVRDGKDDQNKIQCNKSNFHNP